LKNLQKHIIQPLRRMGRSAPILLIQLKLTRTSAFLPSNVFDWPLTESKQLVNIERRLRVKISSCELVRPLDARASFLQITILALLQREIGDDLGLAVTDY
jgi:hypothetical protein